MRMGAGEKKRFESPFERIMEQRGLEEGGGGGAITQPTAAKYNSVCEK